MSPNASFEDAVTYRKVLSSDGHSVYTVTERGGVSTHCTCPGFTHRETCKHLHMEAMSESVDMSEPEQ